MIPRIFIVVYPFISAQVSSCPLEGYWKSDEQKTLASFRNFEGATEKQKELFLNNFFGKLYIHNECTKSTSVMDDWIETSRYEVVSSNENRVTVKYHSEHEGEVIREAKIEGDCYSLAINGGQFKEYFCPVSAEAYNKAIKFAQQAAQDGQ